MSHHEFELALGNLDSVVASNYDFELSPQRHVEREEIGFIGWCDQWMPDLPPSFTRYYIDLILAKRPGVMRKRWSRPWPFETMSSTGVVLTPWQTLRFDAPNAVLEAPLRFPSSEVTLAVECQGRETVIEVEGAVAGEERHVLPESNPACTRMLRVRLEKPTDRVRIAASQAALISSLVYAYDVPTGLEPVVTSAHQADNNAQCSARSSVG